MKMSVQITEANEVIGNGVGAVMQVREVLRILQQHPDRAMDLENKVIFLATKRKRSKKNSNQPAYFLNCLEKNARNHQSTRRKSKSRF